MNLLTDIYI